MLLSGNVWVTQTHSIPKSLHFSDPVSCPPGAHLCTQEVSGSPEQHFTMLWHRLFFFSILVRQQQFFQHNSVKSNSHCWLQVFILAIELLISFDCQQKLSWRSQGAGLSPKFTFRVSHCSWFLPSVTLEESRSSSNYAWPELFFRHVDAGKIAWRHMSQNQAMLSKAGKTLFQSIYAFGVGL